MQNKPSPKWLKDEVDGATKFQTKLLLIYRQELFNRMNAITDTSAFESTARACWQELSDVATNTNLWDENDKNANS